MTGVQTCALPIFQRALPSRRNENVCPAAATKAHVVPAGYDGDAKATVSPEAASNVKLDCEMSADHAPTAMVFVPCRDGLSHTPLEDADTADAGLAAEIILGAIRSLQG